MAILGWIGGIAFALCGAPQALACYRQGHARGISPSFIGLWALGEVCTAVYVALDVGLVWPLLANYAANAVFIGIVARYRLFPVDR